ncbi:hypothetical protein [Paraburkholderia diazotrophica]|uniref:Uncharacterized protein n=1 Tax=Paraburkholderia diazotrophica TaxID=667676 RepID=A0A1H6YCV5_9BURK|nr:hypothetical protein [Paraburkholderia diazotrophica]SEJ38316.1 hypothetical protein SAMN05192539_101042 [Paraburkholderia diazotrophica]
MVKPDTARPVHPYIVLLAAVLLPGAGQLINRMPTRALIMLFFMLSLGFVTLQLAAPGRSFIGRHAGGVFVYAIAVMDAYLIARYRWEMFRSRLAV